MSFVDIANHIIENSIVSSVYIDDNVVEPFELWDEMKRAQFDDSKGLYSSFKAKNKSLDFYKFHSGRDWNEESDYIFKNRDLLILDWELNPITGLIQADTLAILSKAVNTDSLHFVSIYTNTNEELFRDILYSIKAFFETSYVQETRSKCEELLSSIDNEGMNIKVFDECLSLFKDLSLGKLDENPLQKIDDIIKNEIQEFYPTFRKQLKEIDSNSGKAFEILGFHLNGELINQRSESEYLCNLKFLKTNFILINHTIIQLTNKKNPKPKEHFQNFTSALLEICGNPLTVTSLEIRNLLRESSGFIGKDLDDIVDEALFHHYDIKLSKGESFFDFIVEIQKSHLLSTLNQKIGSLVTLEETVWEDYRAAKEVAKRTVKLKEDPTSFQKEVAKLNVHYNQLHINKNPDAKIRFGEVFYGLNDQCKPNGVFWLNVTAHCDGARPKEKIKNNFYFVQGLAQPKEIGEILKNSETRFVSYLCLEKEMKAIIWNNGLIILKVDSNQLDNYVLEGFDGIGAKYQLKYLATLKENYAQRMANNSFSFAMRVGIDFASI